jgi:predicted ABC-type sugar transport system permease subunit
LSAIRDLVARVAISLESEAIDGDNWSDLLDRYIAPVAGGTSVAGLVALMASSTTAAPVIVAVGLCGLALAGASRFWMKATATSDKRMAKLVARLLDSK